MTTQEMVYKAFDIWCLNIYNKKYPYTKTNLCKFLNDVYSSEYDYPNENNLDKYLKAHSGSYFGNEIKKFITDNEHKTTNT